MNECTLEKTTAKLEKFREPENLTDWFRQNYVNVAVQYFRKELPFFLDKQTEEQREREINMLQAHLKNPPTVENEAPVDIDAIVEVIKSNWTRKMPELTLGPIGASCLFAHEMLSYKTIDGSVIYDKPLDEHTCATILKNIPSVYGSLLYYYKAFLPLHARWLLENSAEKEKSCLLFLVPIFTKGRSKHTHPKYQEECSAVYLFKAEELLRSLSTYEFEKYEVFLVFKLVKRFIKKFLSYPDSSYQHRSKACLYMSALAMMMMSPEHYDDSVLKGKMMTFDPTCLSNENVGKLVDDIADVCTFLFYCVSRFVDMFKESITHDILDWFQVIRPHIENRNSPEIVKMDLVDLIARNKELLTSMDILLLAAGKQMIDKAHQGCNSQVNFDYFRCGTPDKESDDTLGHISYSETDKLTKFLTITAIEYLTKFHTTLSENEKFGKEWFRCVEQYKILYFYNEGQWDTVYRMCERNLDEDGAPPKFLPFDLNVSVMSPLAILLTDRHLRTT